MLCIIMGSESDLEIPPPWFRAIHYVRLAKSDWPLRIRCPCIVSSKIRKNPTLQRPKIWHVEFRNVPITSLLSCSVRVSANATNKQPLRKKSRTKNVIQPPKNSLEPKTMAFDLNELRTWKSRFISAFIILSIAAISMCQIYPRSVNLFFHPRPALNLTRSYTLLMNAMSFVSGRYSDIAMRDFCFLLLKTTYHVCRCISVYPRFT